MFLRLYTNLSNFNCKPQVESRQQHLALYMDRRLRSVAILIEVTSRRMECTHLNVNYSWTPAVVQQRYSTLVHDKMSVLHLATNHFYHD